MAVEDEASGEHVSLHELIVRSADAALSLQRDDGSFPAGENYAYGDPETPVRNTARWLRVLCEAYDLSAEEQYYDAATAAVDFLLSNEARPHGYTFHCRKTRDKDKCNGLVGQAGPLRALTFAGEILDRTDAIETARTVFNLLPFDSEVGLWERIEIDGQNLSFDRTLNHQILFATGCVRLSSHHPHVENRIESFLTNLESNMALHDDGLIKHYIHPPWRTVVRKLLTEPRHYSLLLNALVNPYYSLSSSRRRKELSYQPINLQALAVIKSHFPDHPIWNSDKIKKGLDCIMECRQRLLAGEGLPHAMALPGTALATIFYEFENKEMDDLTDLIKHDFDKKLNKKSLVLEKDTEDVVTQGALAAIYIDLPNVQVHLQ